MIKRIVTRYPGNCSECRSEIPAGTRVEWDREHRQIWCLTCRPETQADAQHRTYQGPPKVRFTHEERLEIARRVMQRAEVEQPAWYKEMKMEEAERVFAEKAAKAGWRPVWQRNERER